MKRKTLTINEDLYDRLMSIEGYTHNVKLDNLLKVNASEHTKEPVTVKEDFKQSDILNDLKLELKDLNDKFDLVIDALRGKGLG